MDRKTKIAAAAAFVIAAIVTASALTFTISPKKDDTHGNPVFSGLSKIWTWKSSKSATPALPTNDPFSDKIVSQLQQFYGDKIADKATQAGLVEIRDMVVGTHPENGRDYFYAILRRAFPDYADEIMDTLDRMDRYSNWLMDNKDRLAKMTATGRLNAMWEKRKELFGKDAEKIWSGELLATEARQAKVQDTLAALNESGEMSMDERLDVYKGVLHEAYDGTPEAFILAQGVLLSKVFFSIDSVQEDLNRMAPDQRQQEINRLRTQMGFTDKQLESMARRDADNAKRWDAGLKYMTEREAIVKEYEGEMREEKLKELRSDYFGDEANTIALEEKDDFYRFKRPHIWGRN